MKWFILCFFIELYASQGKVTFKCHAEGFPKVIKTFVDIVVIYDICPVSQCKCQFKVINIFGREESFVYR
jgi:hypothetical protein